MGGVFRRMRAWLAVFVLVFAAMSYLSTGAALAAFDPQAGPVFNNPESDTAEQYAIMQRIEDDVDSAPAGSVIRMAFYSINLEGFADRLIAAHRRGVYVQVLMDQHSKNSTWTRLVTALGGKVSTASASSFAALCYGGCVAHHYADGAPAAWLHTKLYLFSGGGKRTVTISSANPTDAQAEVAWNNSYTVVADDGLYNAYVKTFTDMAMGVVCFFFFFFFFFFWFFFFVFFLFFLVFFFFFCCVCLCVGVGGGGGGGGGVFFF